MEAFTHTAVVVHDAWREAELLVLVALVVLALFDEGARAGELSGARGGTGVWGAYLDVDVLALVSVVVVVEVGVSVVGAFARGVLLCVDVDVAVFLNELGGGVADAVVPCEDVTTGFADQGMDALHVAGKGSVAHVGLAVSGGLVLASGVSMCGFAVDM